MDWALEMLEIIHLECAIPAERPWIQWIRDTAVHLVTMMSVNNVHDDHNNSILSMFKSVISQLGILDQFGRLFGLFAWQFGKPFVWNCGLELRIFEIAVLLDFVLNCFVEFVIFMLFLQLFEGLLSYGFH